MQKKGKKKYFSQNLDFEARTATKTNINMFL